MKNIVPAKQETSIYVYAEPIYNLPLVTKVSTITPENKVRSTGITDINTNENLCILTGVYIGKISMRFRDQKRSHRLLGFMN
jgi:hypothetical protein